MNEPRGELVSLGFYFSGVCSADALRNVALHCLQQGGVISGEALISSYEGARSTAFQSIYESPVESIFVDTQSISILLDRDDIKVVKVGIWSAIGLSANTPEIVTFDGISAEAAGCDNHPVAIVGEASPEGSDGEILQEEVMGLRCFTRFRDFCEALTPDYGAILVENSLACRSDLTKERGRQCFLNFYVGHQYGPELLEEVEKMYHDSYLERLATGLFVSTYPAFNPSAQGIPIQEALSRSAKVARLLAIAPCHK
jgi:hypothetical protein